MGLGYTGCIDKKSSAELSEAINSIYRWYWDAAICYGYISDCHANQEAADGNEQLQDHCRTMREFETSRWFTRGWTLQELLAPDVLEFYDSNWQFLGTKSSRIDLLHAATTIGKRYLLNRNTIKDASIAAKFSWASNRKTTRLKDMAYCLLGLVDVNMPMLYGEGEKAFYRLQLEIIKLTNEHMIFAWNFQDQVQSHTSLFAPSPTFFANAADLRPTEAKVQEGHSTYEMTNHGLHITFPCIVIDQNRVEAILNCTSSGREYVGVWLERSGPKTYMRLPSNRTRISEEEFQDANSVTM